MKKQRALGLFKLLLIEAAAVGCVWAPNASAQSTTGLDIKPGLEVSRTQTNNFYSQTTGKETAVGLVISPTLSFSSNSDRSRTSLGLSATYANFDVQGNEDNYLNSNINGGFSYKIGTRHQLSLSGASDRNHDAFGTARTQGASFNNAELDKYVNNSGSARYRFGAPDALLNFEFEANGSELTYLSNRDPIPPSTFGTRSLDRQTLGGSLAMFINVSPKTALVAETGYSSTRFDFLTGPGDFRDGNSTFYRAGVRWRAAAKTTGDIRVGVSEREIEATGQRAFRGGSWVASVIWQAAAGTTITAQTSQSEGESFIANSPVIVNHTHAVTWQQNLTRSLSATLSGSLIESEFIGVGREEDLVNIGLSLSYEAARYFTLNGSINHTDRESTEPNNSFDSLSVATGIRISL